MRRSGWAAVGLIAALLALGALFPRRGGADDSYLPERDETVLAHVGSAPRAQVATDLPSALALARRYVAEARAESDPRYLGYAQAALAPWWDLPSPPASVLVLRATIRQSNHDFPGALADLELALAERPEDAQAWLTRAVVETVTADYAAARRSCEALRPLATPLVSTVCLAGVDGSTGRAAEAIRELERALRGAEPPAIRAWAFSTLGELRVRAGDPAGAEQAFRQVLAIDGDDTYVLGVYADLLIDLDRKPEATALLHGREAHDALLLRLAIAEPSAERIATLRARHEASRARGDRIHLREEARFALEVDRDAERALELAVENWGVQREVADARILLEAAAASRDRAAAAPVLAWMASSGIEEPNLARLARELEGAR